MKNDYFEGLKQEITSYGKSVGEIGRLRLIGIVSRILGLFLLIFTVILCVFALLAFGSVAALHAMTNVMPLWAAALILGAGYIIIIFVVIACRKPLFIHPFIRLLSKQLGSEEELALKTLEAEHQAEIDYLRIENRVTNTTREINLYIASIRRVWSWLSSLLHKK